MIYTVTLNPSIDFIVRIDKVEIGEVNRMDSDDKFAGGKGINVSRILQRLGIDNTATGFIGGFTGRFVTESLDAEGIKTKFVAVNQDTRINVKIKADQETEINGTGPVITEEQLAELEAILSSVTADDVVVFAGSAPSNLGNKVYNKLIPLVRVIISMAGDGALLVTPEAAYFAKPIKGTVKNSVGAGDSMVAGFTGEFVKSGDPIEALKWGVACGTSTAFSDDLATIEFIKETYNKVEVEKL